MLGEITTLLDGKPITEFLSQKELALLAYLAHSGQAHGREALADLLWEARSTKQSLSNLRTALARLRKQVGDHLIVTRRTVAVTATVHEQTDTTRFQSLLAGAGNERSVQGIDLLTQGLALYSGELMAGFSLATAPRFNDWLVVEQERLRQVAMNGYRRLAGWQEEQGTFGAGVVTAQRWVDWDPLDEMAQQQLMRLLAHDGHGSEALRVYDRFRQLLQTELAISPAPTTVALYESIRDGALAPPDIARAPLHNLPRVLTPLFGRENEIEKLSSYLLDPDYPLVSITGAGGMGKTSLALDAGRHLLAEVQHPFKDGIWFVSLEAIGNDTPGSIRDVVAAMVGQAMGLLFHAGGDLWSQLLGQLASKNLLLILDNIEQFLTVASGLIVELLAAGENIHLLVTSRTTLALGTSFAFPLGGLDTPTRVSPEALDNASVLLFAERAARALTPFDLEKNLAEVVAICRFVEGMPLGIELAAASLGRLMMDEIMPALRGNLQLLNSTHRDLPPRQRTLQAVFDYTWNLLNARERALLAQLTVFRGGFTRQAAESVLGGLTSGLASLLDHALLARDETGRFRMHSLLRQLAREKLSGPDMLELAAQGLNCHSTYYARLLQSFEHDLRRGVGQEAIQTILPEQANLRAAWQHAVQTGQWQVIADCLDGAHSFFKRRGLSIDEAALVDVAIIALQASMDTNDAFLKGLLSRLLTVRAWDYLRSADFEEGLAFAQQACMLAQKLESSDLEASARLAWARILAAQRRREPALTQFEKAVALAQSTQNRVIEADGWIGIGEQLVWQADVSHARALLQQALDLCQTLQYKLGEMEALRLLGTLAFRQEGLAESANYHTRALELSRLLEDVEAEAEELGSLGVVSHRLGDLIGSQFYKKEALATFQCLNMPESEQWLLGELGNTATLLGDYAGAEQYLLAAMTLAQQLKDDFWQAWVNLRLGVMWNEQGQSDKALFLITDAYETAELLQNPRFLAAVLYHWGLVLLGQADWTAAEQKLLKAGDLWHSAGQSENALSAVAGLAYVAHRQGMEAIAAAHAERLWASWQETPRWADRADLKLYWMLGTVWDGLGDCRANDVWNKARELLHARCEKIPDEDARKMFLEQVPAHRAILNVSV